MCTCFQNKTIYIWIILVFISIINRRCLFAQNSLNFLFCIKFKIFSYHLVSNFGFSDLRLLKNSHFFLCCKWRIHERGEFFLDKTTVPKRQMNSLPTDSLALRGNRRAYSLMPSYLLLDKNWDEMRVRLDVGYRVWVVVFASYPIHHLFNHFLFVFTLMFCLLASLSFVVIKVKIIARSYFATFRCLELF